MPFVHEGIYGVERNAFSPVPSPDHDVEGAASSRIIDIENVDLPQVFIGLAVGDCQLEVFGVIKECRIKKCVRFGFRVYVIKNVRVRQVRGHQSVVHPITDAMEVAHRESAN